MIGIVGSTGWIGKAVIHQMRLNGMEYKPVYREDCLTSQKIHTKLSDISAIINCASPGSTESSYRMYVDITRMVANEALRCHIKYLHIGSASEFGVPQAEYISDEHPIIPISRYGEIKGETSRIAQSLGGFVVRPFNILGPNQPVTTPAGEWIQALSDISLERPALIIRNGSLVRDYVPLSYVAKVLVVLTQTSFHFPEVNICSEVGTSFDSLADLLILRSGSRHSRLSSYEGGIPRVVGRATNLRQLGLFENQEIRQIVDKIFDY